MDFFAWLTIWVLASVLAGLLVGAFIQQGKGK